MKNVNVKELEVGISTEYGVVAEMVHVSDAEVVINMVDNFYDNSYDSSDDETFEQFEFDSEDTISVNE